MNEKKKYLTFSYDDGVTQDVRLIDLFNKYGMKATFNLNSRLLGQCGEIQREGMKISHDKNAMEDIKYIYEGHEVAVHTLSHRNLAHMTRENDIVHQVEDDRIRLSELCGYEILGMAYPCGGVNYNAFVSDVIRKYTGIKYARTIRSSRDFSIQENLYEFNPTVHQMEFKEMLQLGERFLEIQHEKTQIFFVWGHSYELDIDDNWKKFEEFLEMMCGRDDICYCTNKEALLLRQK